MVRTQKAATAASVALVLFFSGRAISDSHRGQSQVKTGSVLVHRAVKFDVSPALVSLRRLHALPQPPDCEGAACGTSPSSPQAEQKPDEVPPAPVLTAAGTMIEQTSQGSRPAVPLLESFEGLGVGFEGPQGTSTYRNPSDNSLAAGPDHIVQIVNSRVAVFSKKGARYRKSGYREFGRIDYPPDHQRIFLQKQLTRE